jgi:GntR family transcriptional regulator
MMPPSPLPPSSSDDRLPRYHRIRDALQSEIAAHTWRPGQPLPTETELAKSHGVSIGTVRKAVDSLVADGVLERFQGKGTFIRRPDFQSSLFRFFRHLSVDGTVRIPESRILKREETTMPAAVATAMNCSPGAAAIRLLRVRSLDGKPLLAEDIFLPRARFAPLLEIDPREFGDLLYPLYEQYCGVIVTSARETLSAEAATARHAKLLELEAGAPVIVIERVALGLDRHPLEWRQSRGPADQFRYHVEIR